MKRTRYGVAIAVTLVMPISAMGQGTQAPRIGIVYTAPITVINEIIEGFKEVVVRHFPQAQFIERHASGNVAEYTGTYSQSCRKI